MRKLRGVEVFDLVKDFYGEIVNENKKEVLNDLLMFLNRYEITTKYVVELLKVRQNKKEISVDIRVSVVDTENEFMDFGMFIEL